MGSTRPRSLVLDAGALILFDRADARMRALIGLAREQGVPLVVPVGALAQAWRDGSRQARLAALTGSSAVRVDPLDEPAAKAAGVLCGRAGTSDVVDASVVLAARAHRAPVVTTDPDDLRRLDPGVELQAL